MLILSRSGYKFPVKPILLDLRTENTAAASVEETIAPSKSPSENEIPLTPIKKESKEPSMNQAKVPSNNMVMKTPTVERLNPFPKTGRIAFHSVSNPPEKRMKIRAKSPINLAIAGLFSEIPPTPAITTQ